MSYGNEWDTYSASMNETTARVRRATEKLRTAEALAAVAASGDSSFNPLAAARASAWEAYGLYWEHDWTADGPVPQQERAAWQIRVQQRISGYVDSLYELAAQKLAARSAHMEATGFANSPRIEIDDSIQANFRDLKLWCFSFDLRNPVTHHEELGAVLTVKKETRGGNYFFKLGKSTPDSLWEGSAQLNALAGGQTDPYTASPTGYKDTVMLGIYNQNGQTGFQYHFALTSHNAAFDPVAAMKFSLEHQNPLVAFAAGGEESVRNGSRFSLVSINDPQVLLWSVKPAEEGIGHGLITRFWNMKNISSQPTVQLHTSIRQAWQVSHIETNEKRVPVQRGRFTAPLRAHQLASFRLLF